MANTNVVVLTGRCVRPAELKYIKAGLAVCTFSVAVNERVKKKGSDECENRPNYFDIVCYGNYGKAMQAYLTQGREVTVTGRLHQDRWEAEGKKFSRVNVIAENMEIQREPKGNGAQNASQPAAGMSEPPAPCEADGNEIPFDIV